MRFLKSLFSLSLRSLVLFSLIQAFLLMPPAALAQTAGEGTISGTVADNTGAVIPNATVTATNVATNVSTERTSTSAGLFTITPLPPGTYTVRVTAAGFRPLIQNNLVVNALGVLALNPVLSIGEASEIVTVTEAPPQLNTSNATLSLTMENETYANLPLQMSNSQRDPTAFGVLSPGAQGGARLPIIGGTGNYLGQLYLDGMPAETISQQGDNRLVSQAVDLDAVDQFQVVTSTPPAEYSGAGAMNFTMKSGGLQYHGQVSDFVRNTVFDAWSFTAKAATTKNAQGQTVPAPKPTENQNELSATIGGKVPKTGNRLFFFFAYDKFRERKGANYVLYTIPTALMRTGDFTEFGTATPLVFDPTTTTCVGSTCTRKPFQGVKNGVPTNNVIPASYISPSAKAMQSFLPDPTNSATVNNYLGGLPSGFDNHVYNYRVDFDLSAKHRISTVGALGTVNYLNNYSAGGSGATAYGYLPPPYVGGDLASIYPKVFDVEDAYTISPRLVNQLKYGYVRFFQNIQNATQGVGAYSPQTLGISNLPAGQASEEFPGATFGQTGGASAPPLTGWTQNSNAASTQLTTPNNYTIVDNLAWVKGRHSLTFGISIQWQQINNANPATFTGVLSLAYNSFSTAQFSSNSNALNSGSGYAYASYLLGAVGGSATGGGAPSIGLQPVSEVGGRYRPIAPYVEDNFKVNNKLTLDLGLRWDYLPPYHEVQDRWTFLNPNLTNGATGTPGALQFAGNYGGAGVSCGCRTPVQTYWKNWGPRVGLIFSPDEKTVLNAGGGVVFSAGGGIGGRGGAFNGTGQTGFNVTATGPTEATTGATAGPSFWLNNSSYYQSIGLSNTSLFGPGYQYPSPPTPSPASQILNTGFYLNNGKFVTASGVSYADPYVSGRAPQFIFYNAGIQRSITKDMTIAVNYVGNSSHFLINSTNTGTGGARGYWSNQLNPIYLAGLGGVSDTTGTKPILIAPATSANVAKAQAAMPGISIPQFFQNAAAVNTAATIAQGLVTFPQYSGVTDTWGQYVGNFSYNSLQISVLQRVSRGLTFNINYTYSKNIGDDGTFRNGYDIPAAAISGGGQNWKQDRIDRSWTTVSGPQSFHAFGVYQLPFGKGSQSFWVRALASGWQTSGIYSYSSGTPMAVVSNLCTATNFPLQGQCMPDLAPNSIGRNARLNGSFGSGPNGTLASNLGVVKYVDSTAFAAPQSRVVNGQSIYLIGNTPRTRAFNLNNPGTQNLDASVRRSFGLPREMSLVFEVDCLNVWNKVTFAAPNVTYGSTAFGTISGLASGSNPRDFQFAGHFKF